jgi:carboxymethylenebutenolidase
VNCIKPVCRVKVDHLPGFPTEGEIMPGSFVEVPIGAGGTMPAYYVPGSVEGANPGIVLLQEIFGINANIRETAATLAKSGYDVIVPDLFWRQEPRVDLDPSSEHDRERATLLMKGLDVGLAIQDSLAATAYLRASAEGPRKIGAVGYCLGGKLAYLLAMGSAIDASVSYYGVAIQGALDQADDLQIPLLMHIAERDHLCPPEAQAAIHQCFDNNENVRILDHSGVGHGFARRGFPSFDPEAAGRADRATAAFLTEYLGNGA